MISADPLAADIRRSSSRADVGQPRAAGRLLVRLANWVGDVVLALPVLQELTRAGFEPVLAGRQWCHDLLAAYPMPRLEVDRNHLTTALRLRRLGIRNGLLLTRSFGSALEMWLAGIRAVGSKADGRTLLLHRSIAKRAGDHLIVDWWRVGRLASRCLGGDRSAFGGEPGSPVLRLSAGHRADARAVLAEAGISPPFQVWCPLAANTIRGRTKVWPHFPELCRLATGEGVRVVSCPGPGEEGRAAAALPGATIIPGLGLGAMAAVMEHSQFVLANDTGPMHIAAGIGAWVLGLFGPGNDPSHTGPIGGRTLGGGSSWPEMPEVLDEVLRPAER